MDEPASLRCGEHGDRVGRAGRDEVGALEGIDGDVDLGSAVAGRSDLLADVEHRGFVPLALADDDRARHLDLVHRPAHGLGRQPIGLHPVAATHEPRRRDRGCLCHADHLECEKLLHRLLPPGSLSRARRKAAASTRASALRRA
jgi:hypothetical protein